MRILLLSVFALFFVFVTGAMGEADKKNQRVFYFGSLYRHKDKAVLVRVPERDPKDYVYVGVAIYKRGKRVSDALTSEDAVKKWINTMPKGSTLKYDGE